MNRFVYFSVITLSLVCSTGQAQTIFAEEAPEWTALFDRTSGWTGADGCFAIPLTGDDSFGSARQTVFTFGDSFIGGVDENDQRLPGTVMVNNTIAVLSGSEPDPDRIRFYWGREGGEPTAAFVPATPNAQPDDWFWLKDGVVVNNRTHVYAFWFTRDSGEPLGYRRAGVTLITLPTGSRPPFADQIQRETPLFVSKDLIGSDMLFGAAVLANTEEAGSPLADGYLYVYGFREDGSNKKLVVARVLAEEIEDFTEYRYWDGAAWVVHPASAAPIGNRMSTSFSVTPLPSGKYLLVFQLDTISRKVVARLADSPVGPFDGEPIVLWECPEPLEGDRYVYNAKAHPHLSKPGELLIAYDVNSTEGFFYHFDHADIYHPRFIRVWTE